MTQPLPTSLGIDAIASYIPANTVDNGERGASMGFDPAFLENKIGFRTLSIAGEQETTSDLAKEALTRLLAKVELAAADIDCLVVCTQNPGRDRLPNVASVLHGELGLQKDCAAFDISLGCSGFVYGLSVLKAFMAENGFSCGVLVTADPYSKIVAADDRDTAALFGDGATATLVRPNGAWQVGRSQFGSDGTGREAISLRHGEQLHMNGRRVFAFAATVVPDLLKTVAEANGTTIGGVDRFIVHQGSRYIVDELARRLGVDHARMPFAAQETGNLVSSSIPVLLEPIIDEASAQSLVIAGFGVGLSWGATYLNRHA